MMKSNNIILSAAVYMLVVVIVAACQPGTPGPTGDIQITRIIENDLTYGQIQQTKTFDQCNSSSPLRTNVQFSDSSTQTNQQQLILGSQITGGGELPTAMKLEISGSIEKHFSETQEQGQVHTESASIEVPAHTRQEYMITWREIRRNGSVEFMENGEPKSITFSYRIGLELISTLGQDISCSAPLPPNTTVSPTPNSGPNTPIYSSPVHDIRIRQAIAYCTDRHALTQEAYPTLSSTQIDELVMDSFLRKSHWAYIEQTVQYPYDPQAGQDLLDQAGWTWSSGQPFRTDAQGKELSLTLTTTGLELRKTWASAFKIQMQACGINIITSYVDPDWLFGAGTGATVGEFELGGWYWETSDDPDVAGNFACESIPTAQNGWAGGNWNRWCNPIASEAAKKASDSSLSHAERIQFFATLQEEFAKDLPSLPLFFRSDSSGWEHIEFNLSK